MVQKGTKNSSNDLTKNYIESVKNNSICNYWMFIPVIVIVRKGRGRSIESGPWPERSALSPPLTVNKPGAASSNQAELERGR